MIEPSVRLIAIQAIALRASGTPAEAAVQILEGISALDFPGKPLVIWPTNLRPLEQIEALELELKRVRHAPQGVEDYWAMRESPPPVGSGVHPEYSTAESHPEASGAPVAGAESQPVHGEAAAKAALHPAQKPDRGASDVSQ